MLGAVIECAAEVGSITEVVEAPPSGGQAVKATVEVLQQANGHHHLPFLDLLVCPGELLTHFALPSKDVQGLSDVGKSCGFRFGLLEYARDLHIENCGHYFSE